MPNQRSRDAELPDPAEQDRQLDNLVLGCLLTGASWPWSVAELGHELESEANAIDTVNRLQRAGMLHRCGDFVFPTRSARRAAELRIDVAC